jgi:hypothetical protein
VSRKHRKITARSSQRDEESRPQTINAQSAMPGKSPCNRCVWLPLSAVVLIVSCIFLFFRLGHYPLWCDEAETAIYARGIARTGDTLAKIDHNIYVLRNGSLLKNLHGRYVPPASLYLAAPFVGVSGTSSLWPRVPFAACGLLSVVFLIYWMARSRLSSTAWIVMSIALLVNVSFFLFCRQCRYYSLTILLSLVIVYLYLNWNGRWVGIVLMMLASVLLILTHYLAYAGLYTVLACDYLLFGRRQKRLKIGHWLLLLVPQAIAGIITVWIYNPIGVEVVPDALQQNFILDKLTLIWWNIRDLNQCELYVGILILAAPLIYIWTRNVWLLRGFIAIIAYTLAITILSPQATMGTTEADIRYLTPLLPLFIGLSDLVIVSITRHRWFFALPLVLLIMGSNVANHPFSPSHWSSRPVEFADELLYPRDTSLSVVIQWINDNVQPGESIWIWPNYIEASFMYHAPHPIYAWHLNYPPKEQFAALPSIHFIYRDFPDYFIVFGLFKKNAEQVINFLKSKGVEYRLIKVLDIYWDDLTRPEIFWRSFHPTENFNYDLEAVYVYRCVTPRQIK